MLTFTRLSSGITRTTYPSKIQSQNDVLDVIAPDDGVNALVGYVIRTYGILFPINKELSIFQVSQIIRQCEETDCNAHDIADKLMNIQMKCILTA